MSKILFALLALTFTVASANQEYLNVFQQNDWSPNGVNITKVRYYFTISRAALEGFQMGLYNNPQMTLDPRCLDENTLQMILHIEELWSAGDIGGLFAAMPTFFKLSYVFEKTCNINLLTYATLDWAANNGTNMTMIQQNLLNNIFVLTGDVNEILSVYFGNGGNKIDWTDLADAYVTY